MTTNFAIKEYSLRDVDYYMDRIPETIIEKLSAEEQKNLKDVISSALPKPSPKLVDLRFIINLIFTRYFFVLLIGKDRYKKRIKVQDISAPHHTHALIKIAHRTMALFLFFAINLLVSGSVFLLVYLILSFLGIHIFGGHLNTALRC